MKVINPFHLAFPVTNLQTARDFYIGELGAEEARSDKEWVDFNFFGHQLSAHLVNEISSVKPILKDVDGDNIPIPHFGIILEKSVWDILANQLIGGEIDFLLPPKLRFRGTVAEQWSMFFYDPFNNGIEFKSFENSDLIFQVNE